MTQKLRWHGSQGLTFDKVNLVPIGESAVSPNGFSLTGLSVTGFADMPTVYETDQVPDGAAGDYYVLCFVGTDVRFDGYARFTGVPDAIHQAEISYASLQSKSLESFVQGSQITLQRGDKLSLAFTGLGDLTTATKIYFAVKDSLDDVDGAALVQVVRDLSAGTTSLLYINGTVATATDGAIVVDSLVHGNITVTVERAASRLLPETRRGYWDVDVIGGASDGTRRSGVAVVTRDVSQAVA